MIFFLRSMIQEDDLTTFYHDIINIFLNHLYMYSKSFKFVILRNFDIKMHLRNMNI